MQRLPNLKDAKYEIENLNHNEVFLRDEVTTREVNGYLLRLFDGDVLFKCSNGEIAYTTCKRKDDKVELYVENGLTMEPCWCPLKEFPLKIQEHIIDRTTIKENTSENRKNNQISLAVSKPKEKSVFER